MNIAAKVRQEKDAHPERFCPDSKCLWRRMTRDGVKACPKHPAYHSNHQAPVVGCDRCEDALAEARESLSEWHVGT